MQLADGLNRAVRGRCGHGGAWAPFFKKGATKDLPNASTALGSCSDMLERQVTIINRLGLHARPAAEFVRTVRTFQSSVTVIKNGDDYSGASILDVLSANLDHGSSVVFRAEGPDAEQALDRLCRLLHEFKEQEEAGDYD